jgi:predicted AAA+ superfamily ATPase
VLEGIRIAHSYASADKPLLQDVDWVQDEWQKARGLLAKNKQAVLVLDEIQKVPEWSEVVKRLWDEDTRQGRLLHVVLLGSSPFLIQKGLTESLAGRFEVIRIPHWSFVECRDYFGWDADVYIYYGGYPGAAPLIEDRSRWVRYIEDALIETTVSRDILLLTRIDKPALLRRLFYLACLYSGQIVTYESMLGQLHEKGNTTTLAHYLDLLDGVGFVRGLQKYSGSIIRQRASSPKLQVYNNALMTSQSDTSFDEAREDKPYWGRLVESAVGAHLLRGVMEHRFELFYWREKSNEVDFVIRHRKGVTAVEVKTGSSERARRGFSAFSRNYKADKMIIIGPEGIPVEDFLLAEPDAFMS